MPLYSKDDQKIDLKLLLGFALLGIMLGAASWAAIFAIGYLVWKLLGGV